MALKLFNTLSRKIEEFVPLNPPKVGMYTCGPTVYDYQHIGNFRTMIMSDLLLRTLMANGYEVEFVRNITDIDDKIIKNAAEKGLSIEEFSKDYTEKFFDDTNDLNLLPADTNPKATEHVEKMVKYIEVLVEKGFAYVEKDGSVYFDISKFPDYGKLSQIEKRELKTGSRILSDEYTKDNVQDFALWKAVGPDENVGFDSPWGRGRPGWHIECSVMSQEYLGETFDLHAGGMDLLFPHHENEIAQAEAKTGQPFVKFFVHGEMLMIDGGKMSKSLKNFYLIKDLKAKGFEPLAYRYLTLTAHYRDKLNFTWESLQAAQNALNNLREEVRDWDKPNSVILEGAQRPIGSTKGDSIASLQNDHHKKFLEAINNDLNAPQALAIMWQLVKSDLPSSDKAATLLEMDKVLGLKLGDYVGKPSTILINVYDKIKIEENLKVIDLIDTNIPSASEYIQERQTARENRNFEKSDEYRKKIEELGLEIKDTNAGTAVTNKKKA